MTDKTNLPSFDDIMKTASKPPEPKKPAAAAPPAEPPRPRRPGVPTFAEIIGSVELRPEDRAPRPPPRKPRKEERKMPVVVRRPPLGVAAGAPAAERAEQAASQPAGAAQPDEKAGRPPPTQPAQESAYAQPGADESGDFGALFAESEKSAGKPARLRMGQKVQARVAHAGAEIAYLDLGGKGEAIIDLRELRNDKGELTIHAGD